MGTEADSRLGGEWGNHDTEKSPVPPRREARGRRYTHGGDIDTVTIIEVGFVSALLTALSLERVTQPTLDAYLLNKCQ